MSRFEGTGKGLRAEALDALLGLVKGHPQRAMVAAHCLWRNTGAEADLADWEAARLALMDDVDDELRALWVRADTSEREVLVLVAAGRSPYSRTGGSSRGGSRVRHSTPSSQGPWSLRRSALGATSSTPCSQSGSELSASSPAAEAALLNSDARAPEPCKTHSAFQS